MKFLNFPVFSHLEGKANKFLLENDFKVDLDDKILTIKKGFFTDGASVPRLLWFIFPPISGRYLEAAIVHDALYCAQLVTRKEADRIFFELMGLTNVPKWKRYLMYLAVRLFGNSAWEGHIKDGSKKGCRKKVFLEKKDNDVRTIQKNLW